MRYSKIRVETHFGDYLNAQKSHAAKNSCAMKFYNASDEYMVNNNFNLPIQIYLPQNIPKEM